MCLHLLRTPSLPQCMKNSAFGGAGLARVPRMGSDSGRYVNAQDPFRPSAFQTGYLGIDFAPFAPPPRLKIPPSAEWAPPTPRTLAYG